MRVLEICLFLEKRNGQTFTRFLQYNFILFYTIQYFYKYNKQTQTPPPNHVAIEKHLSPMLILFPHRVFDQTTTVIHTFADYRWQMRGISSGIVEAADV